MTGERDGLARSVQVHFARHAKEINVDRNPVLTLRPEALLFHAAGLPKQEYIMGQTIELMPRITVNPDQCGGRPCVRGMRIRVTDVLDLLAAGLTVEQVIDELPDLEPEDVAPCLRFASQRLDHPVLAA